MISAESALSDFNDYLSFNDPNLALTVLGFKLDEDLVVSDAMIQATAAARQDQAIDLIHSVVGCITSAVRMLIMGAVKLVATVVKLALRHPYAALAIGAATVVYGAYKWLTKDKSPSEPRQLYNQEYFDSASPSLSVFGPQVGASASYRSQDLSSAISRSSVIDAIVQGANIVGVDPQTMLQISKAESAFGTITSQSASSAQGIFQIVSGTWRQHYPEFNKKYGIPRNNPNDPLSASIFASAYVKDVLAPKIRSVKGDVSVTDIYATYVFGPGGGIQLLKEYVKDPNAPTVYTYGRQSYAKSQIRANPTFFYNKDGSLKSLASTYNLIASKVTFTPEEEYKLSGYIQPKKADSESSRDVAQTQVPLKGKPKSIEYIKRNNKIYGLGD